MYSWGNWRETFPSPTAGKFTDEEKNEDTEDNAEIQCIITRANQLLFVCVAKHHTMKNDEHNKLALIDHLNLTTFSLKTS